MTADAASEGAARSSPVSTRPAVPPVMAAEQRWRLWETLPGPVQGLVLSKLAQKDVAAWAATSSATLAQVLRVRPRPALREGVRFEALEFQLRSEGV
jgi:hypothetical protein